MKTIVALLQVVALLGLVGTASADATAPDALVKDTTEQVLETLRNAPGYPHVDKQIISDLVEEKVLTRFDMQRMTQIAVGDDWENATPEQREGIVKEFHQLISHSLAAALGNYHGQPIRYLPARLKADGSEAVVKAQVVLADNDSDAVNFSLVKNGEEWQVYDVSYEGVSMARNYRSQFAAVIKDSGLDGLAQKLAQKNQQNQMLSKKQE
jgi:phospholipid transport system substrate-binding protein